jgi:hypothetical protein
MGYRIARLILALATAFITACASLKHYDCGGGVATGSGCMMVVATNDQHPAPHPTTPQC